MHLDAENSVELGPDSFYTTVCHSLSALEAFNILQHLRGDRGTGCCLGVLVLVLALD